MRERGEASGDGRRAMRAVVPAFAALALLLTVRPTGAQEVPAQPGTPSGPSTVPVVRPELPPHRVPPPAVPPGIGAGAAQPTSTPPQAAPPSPPPPPPPPRPSPVPSQIPEEAQLQSNIGYEPFPSGARLQFNLQDVDLPVLVRIISNLTGRSFILGAKARSIKATIYSPHEVTAAEAYQAFLAVLQANGMTVVPAGRYWVVTESAGAAQEAVSTFRDGEAMPREARMVTRIHRLSHVGADEMANLLNRFKSRDGDVTPYAPTNTIIITDFATNLRRLLLIVQELDVAGTGERIWVEPIHYADAEELAQKIQEVFEAGGMAATGRGPGRPPMHEPGKPPGVTGPEGQVGGEAVRLTRVIADIRTNSIIIVATEPAYRQVLDLVARLDVPVPGEGEIHVHPLQHADAEELAGTLNSLVTGAGPARRGRAPAGAPGQPAGGEALTGQVRIQADPATNALVIVSTPRDYAALREVIAQLDIARRQVFVEAVIMEVSLEKLRRIGLSFHGADMVDTGDENSLLYGGLYPVQTIAIDTSALTGLALGMRGFEIEGSRRTLIPGVSIPAFGVLLSALQTDNDVDVLSTPNILATDNVPAEIMVGGNVPVQQGFSSGLGMLAALAGGQQAGQTGGLAGLGGGGWGVNPFVSVGYQKVGITLKITPQINDSDQVSMEIELEVSEVTGETALGPIISQKTARTTSVVRDQQTAVIGGLMTDNEVETVEKIPFLGDIPILGHLFRHTTTRVTKRNLLIFLTPYIIREPADFRRIFNRKMQERREFIEQITAFRDRQWSPDIDFDRTDGLLEEINRTLADIEEQEALELQLEQVLPPAHTPSEPISSLTWEGMVGPDYVEIAPEGDPGAIRYEGRPIVMSPAMAVPPPAVWEPP